MLRMEVTWKLQHEHDIPSLSPEFKMADTEGVLQLCLFTSETVFRLSAKLVRKVRQEKCGYDEDDEKSNSEDDSDDSDEDYQALVHGVVSCDVFDALDEMLRVKLIWKLDHKHHTPISSPEVNIKGTRDSMQFCLYTSHCGGIRLSMKLNTQRDDDKEAVEAHIKGSLVYVPATVDEKREVIVDDALHRLEACQFVTIVNKPQSEQYNCKWESLAISLMKLDDDQDDENYDQEPRQLLLIPYHILYNKYQIRKSQYLRESQTSDNVWQSNAAGIMAL
ncbi:hypothetical protein HDE_00205 [Halotydeus destructor]|nr:hypothetical protein HDE_00205 [Halotydeus destructor]